MRDRVPLIAGVGGALVFAGLLRRFRGSARREALEAELDRIGDDLARIKAELDAEPDPMRGSLDAFAHMAAVLAEHADRIAEEAYLTTESGDVLRRLRGYDGRLHELTAEIRCRRAKA